jgi:ribosomal protein L16 Arg81 hydroxylase
MNTQTDRQALWLSELLAPVSADEFLSRYWLKQHLFCRGSRERFSDLLSWTTLNEILEHHWRETYRFRLARQGRELDPASYADLEGLSPRIRSKDVTEQLRRGATLSFNAIDEVHTPLTRLAESFERFFRGGTQINIYAGWRALHGLDLHCDGEEIFILHLDGHKRWLLYGVSVDGVDTRELGTASVPPAGALFDRVLQPGDLLYIPRGCYHVAVPANEPTLHLTVGIKNPRSKDLFTWIVERLGTSALADRDISRFGEEDERLRYSEELRHTLLTSLAPDLVEQYFDETTATVRPRPCFSLPWSATPERLPRGRDFAVRLNVHAPLVRRSDSDRRWDEVRCGGRAWRFPPGMHLIIEQLSDGSPVPIGRLVEAVAGRLDDAMVRLLLEMLVTHDLVAVSV